MFDGIDQAMVVRAWNLARALTHSADDADDLMQQAFIVVYRSRDSIPAHVWPWLAVVLRNCWRNDVRRNARMRNMEDLEGYEASSALPPPGSDMERRELHESVHAALQTLPDHEREAVTLCFIGGLTHEQAGQASGTNVNTIKAHVARGLKRLRERLRPASGSMENYLAAVAFPAPAGGFSASMARWKDGATGHVPPVSWGGPGAAFGAVAAGLVLLGAVVFLAAGDWTDEPAVGTQSRSPGATIADGRPVVGPEDAKPGRGNPPADVSRAGGGEVVRPDEAREGAGSAGARPGPARPDNKDERSEPDPATGLITVTRRYYPGGPIEFVWTVLPGGADVRHGLLTRYYTNGRPEYETYYDSGREEGRYTHYYPSGAVDGGGLYKNNKQHGLWVWYHENGVKEIERNYVDGRTEGVWKVWRDNEVIERLNRSKNGKLHGWQIFFDEKGEAENAQLWRNGERIGQRVPVPGGDETNLPDPDTHDGK